MVNSFGIVPMPKRNEEQEKYGAYISNGGATAYSIPIPIPTLTVWVLSWRLCAVSPPIL